jgi:hypothetical protein
MVGIRHVKTIGGLLNRDRKWTNIRGYFRLKAVISGYFSTTAINERLLTRDLKRIECVLAIRSILNSSSDVTFLAGSIAVPAGIWFAGQTEISLAFIAAAILFLSLFVFLPKFIQRAMKADTDAVIDAFGKNEQVKKVFWTLFVAMAGLLLARVVNPVTAQPGVGILRNLYHNPW